MSPAYRLLLPGFSLLAPLFAFADDLSWSRIQCPSAAALDAGIRYCSENSLATRSAQACSAQLSQAWSEVAKDLASLRGDTGEQRLDFGRSQEKIGRAHV